MSIPFSGGIRRSAGIISSISKHLKLMNLKPVNKVTVQFDPFDVKCKETRKFLEYMSAPYVLNTNLNCVLKTNIVCDRSESRITCDLTNGEKVLFKCNNLEALDIIKSFNKHISVLVPPEPDSEPKVVKKLKKQKRKIRISRHRR